jgi:hypothetical protein
MAFVYEVNGQRVEFDREPTDADIDEAARSLGPASGNSGLATETPPSIENTATNMAAAAAARPLAQFAAGQAGDAFKMAKIAGQLTPSIVGEFLSTPIQSAKNLTSAYIAGHPYAASALNTPFKAMPGMAARAVGSAIAAPESAFLMPYQMAAYEQEKIRANPNAPGLEYNPYAQTVRGQAATQGQAGAANQMRTVANMPYGNVSAQERAMLDEDARMRQNIRKKAYEKVMGPVVPGSF